MIINGTTIQSSPNVVDFSVVKRTWFERLFTRPWNPRHPYKRVYCATMYTVGDVILVSPATYALLEKEAAALDKAIK